MARTGSGDRIVVTASRDGHADMNALDDAKRRRFDRWRTTLPQHRGYLAALVAERLLPAFEQRGFVWHDRATAGFLYLIQPRDGSWPAVQLRFHPRAGAMLLLDVACLPETCRRWNGDGFLPVPRAEADIVDAPATFFLRNRRRLAPNFFGYHFWHPAPRLRIRRDVAFLQTLLPRLFETFDEGILEHEKRWSEVDDFLGLAIDRMAQFRD